MNKMQEERWEYSIKNHVGKILPNALYIIVIVVIVVIVDYGTNTNTTQGIV